MDILSVIFSNTNLENNSNESKKKFSFLRNTNMKTEQYESPIIEIDFINEKLNEDQKDCVRAALQTKDLCIIHGPPGTGKTSTLVEIILQLVELNKKVLVVSPSNVAVDTIAERLLKYIEEDSELVCRIGHPTRMLEEVKNISVDSIIERKTNIMKKIDTIMKSARNNTADVIDKKEKLKELKGERDIEVQKLFAKCNIIMATIIGSASEDLKKYLEINETYFDYVIIDESSQAKECECFVPIIQGKM